MERDILKELLVEFSARYPVLLRRKVKLIYCDCKNNIIARAWRSSSTIEFNRAYIDLVDMRLTLAHEIAHLIVDGGHNKQWKQVMRSMGYQPTAHINLKEV